jgi:hypothetical protein
MKEIENRKRKKKKRRKKYKGASGKPLGPAPVSATPQLTPS